jgi:hypothetical protein
MECVEKGVTRRHTFFCVNRERHTRFSARVVEVVPKQIVVFGKTVEGWLITSEEPTIDKVISLEESLGQEFVFHDPE